MTSDFSSSNVADNYFFTATCHDGYVFFKSTGNDGSYRTDNTKVGTCKKNRRGSDWSYDDGGTGLGDCQCNLFNIYWGF